MIPIPSPLHPAVVHFPIVLILAGAVCAVVAVFIRRWHLPVLAAIVLSAGALGAVVATVTGGQEEELAGEISGAAEGALEAHEEWGERARNTALAAGFLAVAAAALRRVPLAGRSLSCLSALVSLAAAFSVAQAGHYGGQLVYRHGVGIKTAASAGGTPAGEAGLPGKHGVEQDDD